MFPKIVIIVYYYLYLSVLALLHIYNNSHQCYSIISNIRAVIMSKKVLVLINLQKNKKKISSY